MNPFWVFLTDLFIWKTSLLFYASFYRALESCEAVSIALGSSTLQASLGMTVYVAAAAGPEGALEAVRVVEGALCHGKIAVAEESSGRGSRPEDAGKGNWAPEEEQEDEGQVDSYLSMYHNLPSDLKPNITLVVVEALPRGWVLKVN